MSSSRTVYRINTIDIVSRAIKIRNYINSISRFKKATCIQVDEALKIFEVVFNDIPYSTYSVTKSKSFEGTYMFVQEIWIKFQRDNDKRLSNVSIVLGFPRSCMEYMEIDFGEESPRIKVI